MDTDIPLGGWIFRASAQAGIVLDWLTSWLLAELLRLVQPGLSCAVYLLCLRYLRKALAKPRLSVMHPYDWGSPWLGGSLSTDAGAPPTPTPHTFLRAGAKFFSLWG